MSATLIEGWRITETSGSTLEGEKGVLNLTLSGATLESGAFGQTLRCNANGENAYGTLPAALKVQPPFSFVVHCRSIGTATSLASIGGANHNDTDSSPFSSYVIGRDSSLNVRILSNDGGSFESDASSATLTLNTDIQFAFIAAADGEVDLYVNGLANVSGELSLAGAIAYGSDAVMVLGSRVASRNANLDIHSAGVWSGVLAVAQLNAMGSSPKALIGVHNTAFSRATLTASDTVRVYASAAIDTGTVGTGDFSISGNTVSGVSATTGYVDVTFSNPVSLGDVVTASVDYGIKDADGLLVEPIALVVQSSGNGKRPGMGLGSGM